MTEDFVRQPNVLLLVADSLRYDAVFGSGSAKTSTLDALAAKGTTFEWCLSQGISTAPAMTAMHTGRYPLDYGGHWYLADDQPTMAEQFRANGYETAAIHSNPNVSRLRNFDKGFETFDENFAPSVGGRVVETLPDAAIRSLSKVARILRRTPYRPADEVNGQLATWINTADEPWFCWTQYMDTHGPYLPGDDFSFRNKLRAERLWRKAAVSAPKEVNDAEHRELRRNYELEVEYLDAAIGRFLDRLASAGNLANTIVVFVGDHGDEFREHGHYGHKNLPYDELVRVPAIIRWPNELSRDALGRITTPARAMDLLPTVLDVLGADLTDDMSGRMEAESLLPVMQGQDPSYDIIVTEKEMRDEEALRFGFRDDRWTYLYDGRDDEEFLYDRDADPNEQHDVVRQHPEVRERFQTVLETRLERIGATDSGVDHPDVNETAAVQERLRALGYKE